MPDPTDPKGASSTTVSLQLEGNEIRGAFALRLAPGTRADERDARVDELLTDALFDAALQLGAVLAADPHAYAHPLDGHDDEGRTRFEVRGRAEGGRVVPVRGGKLRARGR